VDFCDAAVTYCTDIHWLGTAQLTSAGTATLKLLPGNGSHSYKAVFRGTVSYAGSFSTSASLTVSGTNSSVTEINGEPPQFSATVGGIGTNAPSGNVSFVNASGGAVYGTATLSANTPAFTMLISAATTSTDSYDCEGCLVAAGDLNNDGFPDVVTAIQGCTVTSSCATTGELVITAFLGDGKGDFTAAAPLILPNTPGIVTTLSVADFNGDGIPDVAVGVGSTGTILIALGNGDGTFTTKGTVSTGSTFSADTVGDFNNDGIADLAVLGSIVQIFNGNGDGTFTASSAAPAVVTGTSIATADFNGDGVADLALVDSGTVTILLGNGNETFTTSQTLSYSGAIAIGDFNQDGKLDLVNAAIGSQVGNGSYQLTITTLTGNGNGTFTAGAQASTAGPNCSFGMQAQSGDFAGANHADLITACPGIDSMNPGLLVVFPGNGDGTFGTAFTEGAGTTNFAVADFNGDGVSDVANGFVEMTVNQTSTATINNLTLPGGLGTVYIAAQYPGDSNYLPSLSYSSVWDVAPQGTPAIAVAATPNPAGVGSSVTITVTVSGTGATPTGSVSLLDGSASLGTLTLNSSGVATYTSSSLAAGVHSITAQYAGDTNYASGVSSVVSLTVNANPFTIGTQSGGSTTSTVTAGQPAKYSLSISPAQGYTGTVSLTCSNLPANASCSFSPSSLSLTGNTPATFTVTIATQSQTTAALRDVRSMSPLVACILLGLPFVSRRRRARLSVLAWTILLCVAASLSACGGGSSGSGGTSNTGPAKVAPGTYTVQLTVSDGKNSQAQPLTLVVQ
jgi:hypothetical protein